MKQKLVLPLSVIVFAIASAFATRPLSQTGWFKDASGTVQSGVIDNVNTDTHPCEVGRSIQCRIGDNNAYATPEDAADAPSTDGLLKYNP